MRDDDRDSKDSDSRGGRDRRSSGGGGRRPNFRKKVCKFCTQNLIPDYKNPEMLRRYITERGKILPARITGCCAKHQRSVTNEIKKARVLAYLPFEKK
ncbi:MAG TPA: 30S ribosomal protein S18 [Sphaerochaeta sp.]|jgi:small subunit ribosomal protein S18|nr:30S ribosomal protein S18 [Sphaerochaeta sp.]